MKAVVIKEVNKISIEEVAYPKPAENEVVVKVYSAGLCGTDGHILRGEFPGLYPIIPGHEFSGVIHEVGEKVSKWKVGDRVVVDPTLECGKCYHCLSGQTNMCTDMNIIGVTVNGGFAEFAAIPERIVYKIEDHVSFDDAAFIEPLACVVYGMNRLMPEIGSRVFVSGAGPMGLLNIKAMKSYGASEIVCLDISEERLRIAKELGATATAASFEELKKLGEKYDIVIEATGVPQVIERVFDFAGKRAKILQFGCAASDARITINPFEVYNNDWQYIGTRAIQHTFNQAINLITAGTVTGETIVNDFISLDQVPDYLNDIKPKESLKVMVHPHGNPNN